MRVSELQVAIPAARKAPACSQLNLVGGRSYKYAAATRDTVAVTEINTSALVGVGKIRIRRTAKVVGLPDKGYPKRGDLGAARNPQRESAGNFSAV